MLDNIWKNESLCNDIVISDRISNVYVLKVNGLSYELSSDGSIADIESMVCVIYGMTNIHLVYVRIPGKGITVHRCLWDMD
jgi:hypothetical protein